MVAWRAENHQNCGFGGSWGGLGRFWSVFLDFGRGFLRKSAPGYAQDGLRWREGGPGTAQAGPCWRQDGAMVPKMAPLGLILG